MRAYPDEAQSEMRGRAPRWLHRARIALRFIRATRLFASSLAAANDEYAIRIFLMGLGRSRRAVALLGEIGVGGGNFGR